MTVKSKTGSSGKDARNFSTSSQRTPGVSKLGIVLSIALAGACLFAAEPQPLKYIGVNTALEIALQDADPGEKQTEVSGVYRTKDDDGNPVYEVSFTVDEIGYDYVIDAVSGEIMSWKQSGPSFSTTAAFGGGEEIQGEAASN